MTKSPNRSTEGCLPTRGEIERNGSLSATRNALQQPRGGTLTYHHRSYITIMRGLRPSNLTRAKTMTCKLRSSGQYGLYNSEGEEPLHAVGSSVTVEGHPMAMPGFPAPREVASASTTKTSEWRDRSIGFAKANSCECESHQRTATLVATAWGERTTNRRGWGLSSVPRSHLQKATGIRASAHLVVEEPIVGRNRKLQLACHFRPGHGWYKTDPGRGKHILPSDR